MANVSLLGALGGLEGSGLSFRNKLINGNMSIDQRNAGASQTFTAAAALAYSVDRWYGYCTGANVTGQRVAGSGSVRHRYQFTGAASVTGIGFGQRIEASNSIDLAGSIATLSVDLANSVLTTVTWTAFYANTADTFGTLAAPTRTQIATGTFTVSSTVQTYSAQMSIPSAATTGIEVVFTVGAQTSGTWTIGNVQLEEGAAPTPFEVRPIGLEFSLCQRYYCRGGAGQPGLFTGANIARFSFRFPVEMRIAPTVTAFTAPNAYIGAVAETQTGSQTSAFDNAPAGFAVTTLAHSKVQMGGFTGGVDGRGSILLNDCLQASAEL